MYQKANGGWTPLDPMAQHLRRQDLPPLFLRDGLYYFASVKAFRDNGWCFFGSNPVCIELDRQYYVNIDEVMDLEFAKFLSIKIFS
jgi:CMP-N-acetylneuraminic acid synthetase